MNINRGITRSVADNNAEPYAREHGAWLNWARKVIGNTSNKQTTSMLERYQAECPAAISFGEKQFASRSPFNKAFILGMFVLAHPTNPTKVEEFFMMLRGDDVSTGERPLFALRVYLQERYREDAGRDQGMKILRCIRAHIEGERIAASRLFAAESTVDYFSKPYPKNSATRER